MSGRKNGKPGTASVGRPSRGSGAKASRPPGANAREQARLAELASRRRRERRILVVVALALVLVVVGGGIGVQAFRTGRTPDASTLPVGSGFAPVTVTADRPLVLGRPGAPVTLTLYEDFHCPHCADLEESIGATVTELQNAGTLTVELYPMAFVDEGSTAAANAVACAAEAGFGPSYYSGLFANPTLRWSADQLVDLGTATAPDRAGPAFQGCVRDDTHRGWVDSVNAAAETRGVTGTPTVFLDGTAVEVSTLTPERLRELVAQAQRG